MVKSMEKALFTSANGVFRHFRLAVTSHFGYSSVRRGHFATILFAADSSPLFRSPRTVRRSFVRTKGERVYRARGLSQRKKVSPYNPEFTVVDLLPTIVRFYISKILH